ncbi:MAG: response regulator transcription factor [Opitutaceae bacterium]|nr:response regulator transcription factor [Opitutaceae bacterium]
MDPSCRRILVVDEHPVIGSGLARLVEAQAGWSMVGTVCTRDAARAQVSRGAVALVVLEPAIQGLDGLGWIEEIAMHARVLCFSTLEENLLAERALRAGARGYLMKTSGCEEVVAAMHTVLGGGIALSEAMRRRFIGRLAGVEPHGLAAGLAVLNNRELRVVHLLGANHSARQIAACMHVSEKTVATHRQRIREKLRLASARDLVRVAASWVGQDLLS